MFSPARACSATLAYRQIGVQSLVHGASPHQLIAMLFDGLLESVRSARAALAAGDAAAKAQHVTRAVRILQEGLLGALDSAQGGALAQQLGALYEYCIARLTLANARNDAALLEEVQGLVQTVSSGWSQMDTPSATPE